MATIEQRIKFKLDGERQVQNAFKALSREQRDLINEFRTGNKTFEQAEQGLRELANQYENAEQGAKSLEAAVKSLRAEQRLANQTRVNEDRFDTTSRQVALAGDVQSNLGAVSGLLGSAGAGGAAQGVGIAGELIVLTEELPRLKEAIRGMPAAANAAGQALGLGGAKGLIGAMGVTAIAVAAVSVAFNHASKQIDAAKEALQSRLDAELSINQQLATLTTEQINERTRQLEIQRTADQETLAALEASLGEAREKYGSFAVWIAGLFGLNAELKKVEGSIDDTTNEINALADAAESSVVKANDAKEARENETASAISAISAINDTAASLDKLGDESKTVAKTIETSARAVGELNRTGLSVNGLNPKGSSRRSRSTASSGRGFVIGSSLRGRGTSIADEINILEGNGMFEEAARLRAKQAGEAESGITSAYQDAFQERANLIRDYNEQETRIKQEALFAQKQDLEQFKFAQDRLLEQGDFTSAFNRQREKAFQQGQDRDRILFDQSQRRDDLFSQIDRIASALATKIQVELQPNAMFNTTVKNISVQASTVNRSF